jgi:ribonuclease P protein component
MLNRVHRFHGLHSLDFVYRQGKTVRTTDMALRYILNSRRQEYRVAVVVSKKVSKSAVVRNRIRRRVYEAVRRHQPMVAGPYDLVFSVYQAEVAKIAGTELQQRVDQLLRQVTAAGPERQ